MTELHGVAGVPATPERHFDIRFRLDATDYQHAMRNISWVAIERLFATLPSGTVATLAVIIGLFIGPLLGSYVPWMTGVSGIMLTSFVLYPFLLIFYRKVLVAEYCRVSFVSQPIGMGESRLIVDADGVSMDSAGVMTRVAWPLIGQIVESESHVFLMYARLIGFIVPKRVFATAEEAKRFVMLVRAKAIAAQ